MAVQVEAAAIKRRMKERDWKEVDVSHYTKISPSTVRNVLRGIPVSIEFALNLCEGLDLLLPEVSPEAYKRFCRVTGTHENLHT